MTEFVKQCLHSMNSKTGKKFPRSLRETVHGRRPDEVLYFESFNDWGGRGCRKFVPVLGGDSTKIAPTGDMFDQPPGEMI